MDFFDHQDVARRRSVALVVVFLFAVALLVAAVYVSVSLAFFASSDKHHGASDWALWDPGRFAAVAAGTISIIALGSLYKITTLRSGGGESVAYLLGGRPLGPSTDNPAERRLLNVVEEMSLASGIPVPAVYLLEGEESINAFAAGLSTDHAVIGVTRGCMDLLSRDELQGVIGHEFSHVLNGDMVMNIRLMGVLNGILVIALIGYAMLRGGRSSRKGGSQIALLGALLYVVGYAGVLCGRIIKAGVSRQREYLADASAVQFTRTTEGIEGALKKIGGYAAGSRLTATHAEEASHIFFGDALKRSFLGLLTTHPPLDNRIRRLDPRFDGVFPAVTRQKLPARRLESPEEKASGRPPASKTGVAAGLAGAATAASPTSRFDPAKAADRIGTLTQAHVEHAQALLAGLGPELSGRARELSGAVAVTYAILVSRDPEVRDRQLRMLAGSVDSFIHDEVKAALAGIDRAPEPARIALMDLAIPSLRRLSGGQFQDLYTNVCALSGADERIDLFELALKRALRGLIAADSGRFRAPAQRYTKVSEMAAEASALISGLAHGGQPGDAEKARAAFEAGREAMGPGSEALAFLPPERCGVEVIDRALDEAPKASSALKRRLITAATACVAWDRRVTMEEAELLRALGHALACPTPPFIPGVEI